LIIGEQEVISGKLQLKNLKTNSSELVELHQVSGLIS
jgi:histidyl-tRNA synthetase